MVPTVKVLVMMVKVLDGARRWYGDVLVMTAGLIWSCYDYRDWS